MSVRNDYEKAPTYERIEEMTDQANLAEVYYLVGKKPPMPIVSQRDGVVKGYHRESYILEPKTHVFARHSVPCDIEKYKE